MKDVRNKAHTGSNSLTPSTDPVQHHACLVHYPRPFFHCAGSCGWSKWKKAGWNRGSICPLPDMGEIQI